MAQQPDNGPAAAAPTAEAPRRVVQAMRRPKEAPGMDRLKGYLREIPVIHQQLVAVIRALEATAGALRTTTDSVQRLVKQWEEEQKHGNTPAPAPAPAPGPAAPAAIAPPAPVPGSGPAAGAPGVPAGKDAGGPGA